MGQVAITVEELLQLPVLRDACIISGAKGLHNQIHYIDIMEIPDLAGWLRRDEFVLTTGYAFRDQPQALCTLLDEMHVVQGAAIGVKQRRFGYAISDEARQKSEAYGIPLIDIPPELKSIDITHSVMELILNRQFTALRQATDVNREFMQLILNRHGVEIVILVGKLLSCDVAVLNRNGVLLNATPHFREEHVIVTRPIQVSNTVIGYLQLTMSPPEDDIFASMCIEQALMGLALEFTLQHAAQHRKEHAREDFLMELLAGTSQPADILAYRARQLGLSLKERQYILAVKPLFAPSAAQHMHDDIWEQIRIILADTIDNYHQKLLAVSIGEHFAVLGIASSDKSRYYSKDTEGDEGVSLAQNLRDRLQQAFSSLDICVGIGSIVDNLSSVRESYRQAIRAVEIGLKVFPDRHVVYYADVYVEDMLLDLGEHPSLKRLYQTLLHPVYQYDKENGTELFKTIEALVRHGGNTRRVAEELFLHRNSVNYRLDRIQSILKVDLEDPEIRLRLDLALRSWKLTLFSSEA